MLIQIMYLEICFIFKENKYNNFGHFFINNKINEKSLKKLTIF